LFLSKFKNQITVQVTRLFDLIPRQLDKFSKSDSLSAKENGKWVNYSTQQFKEFANNVSFGLIASGISKGDKIVTISNNRPEWNFLDMGILQIGAVHVPVYPTISENDLKFILADAEAKMIFISSADLCTKILPVIKNIPSVNAVYSFNKVNGVKHFSELIETGKNNTDEKKIEAIKSSVLPEDLATLLYTSGTTGTPKGVMLSHHNLVSNVIAVEHLPPADSSCRALSFLPLNHVYERMLTYLYMYLGISIYYAESLETISDNLKEVKPEVFSAVPRLLEKVFDKIVAKGSELKGVKRGLFFWALNLGLRYEQHGANGWWYETQLKLANKIIFNKWREALGGKTNAIVSGGAALQPRLAKVFRAAGIMVLEGYGLTETSPVIAVNTVPENKIGTVGPVIEGVQVKIADDGEILCKGPNVMMGYYKRPDLTAEVIDKDGWLHTGDIGTLDEGKFLKITDRKKEIFKTSGGKYIAPQMIENKLKESRFIEQAMVIGENEKFAAALIVPAFAFIKDWGAKKGLKLNTNDEIANSKEVRERIREEIDSINKTLGHYETIKKFELLNKEFSIESGEMTPKLSLKRRVIIERCSALVKKIYGSDEVI
jgi:long-chain acyl-CoA synthetase